MKLSKPSPDYFVSILYSINPSPSGRGEISNSFQIRIKWVRAIALAVLFCFLFIVPAFAEPVKIESAEIKWHKYYDEILVNTSDYVTPTIKAFPDRLVLTFKDSETSKFETAPKKSSRIKVIRSTSPEGDNARLVIELKKNVKYEIASLYGKGEVLIEISDVDIPCMYTDKGVKYPGPEDTRADARHPIKIEVLEPIISGIAKTSNILKGRKIVIDPGHGGEDPGAFGVNGIREKDLTLKTAFLISDQLRKNGASVFMTRRLDIKNDLSDIVDFTENAKADIYIGVHYNSIDGRSISGTETYYYTPQSFRLASLVHKEMVLNLRRQDRGVRRAMFYTIHHSTMPSVLIEPVYITDPHEGALAQKKSFKKEIADSVTRGIINYFSR
ncbi:N-acetylmuramoyl-L-alanine amidase [Candidatus Saganbacteria bacterium]|nr:N-acetylmuramoyl-L-alanine amidase [Candidatus Saganbacteria bacterium]